MSVADVNEVMRQVTNAPVPTKLELAAALYTEPRPHLRRLASTVVRMALTQIELETDNDREDRVARGRLVNAAVFGGADEVTP